MEVVWLCRVEEIRDQDIGTQAGLFEVLKIGDEFYSFIVDCAKPKACTILLRGASKDVLNEVERNLHDAMGVARNVMMDPRLVPGGGAVEMAISRGLFTRSASLQGTQQVLARLPTHLCPSQALCSSVPDYQALAQAQATCMMSPQTCAWSHGNAMKVSMVQGLYQYSLPCCKALSNCL